MQKTDPVHIGHDHVCAHTDLFSKLMHIAITFFDSAFHAFEKVNSYQKAGNPNK